MDAARYVGIPFIEGGRSLEGCDCYGLVRLVLAAEFGINLPEMAPYSDMDARKTAGMIDQARPEVEGRTVLAPHDGDVVIMRYHGLPSHVGVFIGGRILHTERGTGSVLESATSPRIAGRITEYYRCKKNSHS